MSSKGVENPYEEQQNILLSRIIGNVEKLTEAVQEADRTFKEINTNNRPIVDLSAMWSTHNRNVRYNLEAQNLLNDPK